MALVILEECTGCAACDEECPRDAISAREEVYWIDPEQCDECRSEASGPLCIEVCPIDGCIGPGELPVAA